jgi:hypothetical protein
MDSYTSYNQGMDTMPTLPYTIHNQTLVPSQFTLAEKLDTVIVARPPVKGSVPNCKSVQISQSNRKTSNGRIRFTH